MDKQYYREYYEVERNHWWFRARSGILSSYIKKNISTKGSLRILNVGVATGASTIMLQEFGRVSSLEYEQECIDFIREKVPIEVTHGSVLELPYEKNAFDLVCAFDVIEHVENDGLAVRELKRVCMPGGSVLVTVPAGMNLWSEHDEINHHFRRYSINQLRSVFSGDGKTILASYFNFFLYLPILAARKLDNLLRDRNKKTLRSDFEKHKTGMADPVLFSLLKSESTFLNNGIGFPFGVSAMLHWKKK